MLIDSKGKLFGKISVVDILIIVIVIAAIAGVGYKLKKSNVVTTLTKTDSIQTVLYTESTPESGTKAIKVGDVVKDKVTNAVMGKVTKIETGPSIIFGNDSEGKMIVTTKPGYVYLKVTLEGRGIFGNDGATFGSTVYYVNKSMYEVRVGISSFNITITNLTKL